MALGAVACGPAANPGETGEEEGPGPEIRLPPRSSGEFDCQDIPETGVCRDDVAIYCDRRSSSIVEKRCGARSLSCEISERGARCVDAEGNEEDVTPEGAQGGDCGDVTFEGECDGDGNVLYCSTSGVLTTLECDTANGQE
ncbi:MAG: hypothetical protein KJO07_14200, partial [Deltaproteobacteria bacterium]|nr:hypothetical protein [Deltaproteobacteria bacterium]